MKSVVKITGIVFLSFVVLLECDDLFKIPFLFQHYYSHEKAEHISFTEFLKAHYTANNTDSSEEHHDLPFKACNDCVHFHTCFFAKNESVSIEKDIQPLLQKYTIRNINLLPTNIYTSIWHPPKKVA